MLWKDDGHVSDQRVTSGNITVDTKQSHMMWLFHQVQSGDAV